MEDWLNHDSSNTDDFSDFAKIVFDDNGKCTKEDVEEPIAHRTRSRVKIRESLDSLLEIHADVRKSKVWFDFLTSIDDNAVTIYDNSEESFVPLEEPETNNFRLPQISQRELTYLEEAKEESPDQFSNESEELLPQQLELMTVQITKFVQLAIQICMISAVSDNTDFAHITTQCRKMLAGLDGAIPKKSPIRPPNLTLALEMLEEENLFKLCTSRYDQFLAMEIVKYCKNKGRFYNSSFERLTLNHMDLLVSRMDVFVFSELFFWRYPQNSAKRKTYAKLRYDEMNLLAIGIKNHKNDYTAISQHYLTYMTSTWLAKTCYRLRKATSYNIDFNSVKYLKKFNVLPCFTTSCQLHSMTLPKVDNVWDVVDKPDWLDTFLLIAVFINDFHVMTSLPFNFVSLNKNLELPEETVNNIRDRIRKKVDLARMIDELNSKIDCPNPLYQRFI